MDVEKKLAELYPDELDKEPAKHLVSRFRFMDLLPCTPAALETMGIDPSAMTAPVAGAAFRSPVAGAAAAAGAPAGGAAKLPAPPPPESLVSRVQRNTVAVVFVSFTIY